MPTEALDIELKKKGAFIEIYVKAPKLVEDYYASISIDTPKESSKWRNEKGEGVKFYAVSPEKMQADVDLIYGQESIRTFSDFGQAPMYSGKVNIGFLRAVDISQGIHFNSKEFAISNLDCETFARYLGQALRAIIAERLSDHKVKATITYEI
jgi:hypothetical protein